MEDNNLESLPPPLTTTATATPTSRTTTTRPSTAEHVAATNITTQNWPDQLAAVPPSNKCHHDSPYGWQLLPQEELDRIVYNSRRQKKARLRDNPPRCEHCPEAKFTSLAMLSTHHVSKRHLARVREKEQSLDQEKDRDQALNSDTEEQMIRSGPTPPTQEVSSISAVNNSSSHDVIKEDIAAASENNPITQVQPAARPGKNATQRKRRQERDRKKARARLEKRSKSGHDVMDQSIKGQAETKEKEDEATVSTSNGLLEDAQRPSLMDDDDLSIPKGGIVTPLALTNWSSPPIIGSNVAASSTIGVLPLTSNTALDQQLQQQHWHCSICSSRWRQEKAWRGHLLSAQHLRHTLVTMQQIAPDIRPYGRVDVMASMDPFGWGTDAGVVEEEEEDSDEGDSDDDNGNNVEGKTLENDEDDDMDMSD